ncbi:17-beta-hydroxysteroid dehydrogenase type 2 [Eucyclogobius newberryi]|uniref:17-beta-hydroxysteroid dehydrogenase type 2 n=1 Tax=Eucyclogobius newberryi TaxID=166745 RepID=UPI003B5B799A
MELPRVLLLTVCVSACVAGGLCAWGAWAGLVAVAALMCGALGTRAWSGEETLLSSTRSALITGCDSGFGHALALRLSGRGVQIFAGVLDIDGPGAQSLKEQDPKGITVLHMDVTKPEHVARAKEHITEQLGEKGLWGLVNNAGLLLCPVDAELQSISCFRRLMEVNFLSAVTVTQAFLPLIRRAKGRVVNVSSLAGSVPMRRFSAYSSSKAALSCFSRVLRLEMFQWGVHVALVQPSGFRTKIFGSREDVCRYKQELLARTTPEVLQDYGLDYISQLPSSLAFMSQNSEQDFSPVLECLEHALLSSRPKTLYCPGQGAWLLPFLQRHLPTAVFDRLILRIMNDTCQPSALNN